MKATISLLLTLQDLELQSPDKRKDEADSLRNQIPTSMLNRFDKFLKRGKKGVALVQNSVCRGCQIALPVGVVTSLIQGLNADVCGNCGRYLYLAEADAIAFQGGLRSDTITVSKAKAPKLAAKTVRRGRKPKNSSTELSADKPATD